MPETLELQTPRLFLQAWRDDDLEDLAGLCADAQVMRYFPAPLSRAQSAALLARLQRHFAEHGFCFWALRRREDRAFVGLAGLAHVGFAAAFTPAVEIGWRLLPDHWGQGYAQEAARAALACADGHLALDSVVAFTATVNDPSQRVMQALGMRLEGEFEHPALAVGHPLCRHVLYRHRRAQAGRHSTVR